MMQALDAGAEDINIEDDEAEIITTPEDLEAVKNALETAGIEIAEAEITMMAKNTVEITDAAQAEQLLNLIGKLEDNDDVQAVYSNADIPDDLMEKLSE